jgi:hypothetical protein
MQESLPEQPSSQMEGYFHVVDMSPAEVDEGLA